MLELRGKDAIISVETSDEAQRINAPQAEKKPVEYTTHGDTRSDDYAWLAALDDTQAREFLEAENKWTSACTAHLEPLIETLVKEIASHTLETDTSVPYLNNGWWYYFRTWQGKEHKGLFRIPDHGKRPEAHELNAENGEECVWDANILARGHDFFSATSFTPSPDGTRGALCCDENGDEHFKLRIFDIKSGAVIDDCVTDISPSIAWSADGENIFIIRFDNSWRPYQVWLHPLGQSDHDRLIYQENDPRFELYVSASRDGRWVILQSVSNTTTEIRLIDRAHLDHEPILICPRRSGLDYSVEPAGDHLLIVHNANNVDFELASAPLAPSTPEDWQPIVQTEAGERISWVEAFRDFAVLVMRSGGESRLGILRRDDIRKDSNVDANADGYASYSELELLPLEQGCTIELTTHDDWESTDIVYREESPVMAPRYTLYDIAQAKTSVIKSIPQEILDSGRYRVTNVSVTAEDGTELPLTLYYRADLTPDGNNPGLLYGYGAYEVSNDPYYKPSLLSLIDRGIVLAWAHVRGGGELGRMWYENGKEFNKRNTFTDFIDCARWLEESGWVGRGRLAAEGRSAGGLLIGASLNLAPELFRTVHAGVPFVDVLTTMCNPDLPLTKVEWEEWGNPLESAEIYDYIKSYSPVDNVRECEYPSLLVTTSLHDIRVSWVEPAKWVQVLRERATNDPVWRPILLKGDIAGGHGGVSGRYARWREQAFQYAWIIDQLDADWEIA